MAEDDRVSGNNRSFSEGEGDDGRKRPRTRNAKVLVPDHNGGDDLGDDVSFQGDNFEIVEDLRLHGKETASSTRRKKLPVRRAKMRLWLTPVREKVCIPAETRVDVGGEEKLAALIEKFDWRKIGWEDIDREEDRQLWRASARKLCRKFRNRKMKQGLEPTDRPMEADCC